MISDNKSEMECMSVTSPLDSDLAEVKINLLKHISLSDEAHFKSQQKGDPDLTICEKRCIAEALLNRSQSLFLAKYGKFLLEEHLKYFEGTNDYETNFYLAELQKGKKKPSNKSQIRNRRLEALKRMCEKGEYFSDMEMKRRNPLLYEELVGQYLTDEEKIEFECEQAHEKTFSSIFSAIVEHNFMDSKLKREIENDYNSMKLNGKDDDENKTLKLWGEIGEKHDAETSKKVLDNSRFENISSNEKSLLVNEFRSQVYSDFLGGRDSEFDYSQIDENVDYDDLSTMENDQQESYFDAESPKLVYDEESNESMQ